MLVIKYHEFWPVFNILDAMRLLPPQALKQLDMLHKIKAVLFAGNSHKIASVPINVFNL